MASDLDGLEVINPPFRGKQRKEVQQNFPIGTGKTTFPLLHYFIRILTAGGRAWIVIRNTFLSNTDNGISPLGKAIRIQGRLARDRW